MTRQIVITFVLACLAAACSIADAGREQREARGSTAGDGGEAARIRIADAPDIPLTLAARIDGNELDLVPIASAVILPDGGLAVTQPLDRTVRLFHADGRPAGQIGRRGSGPGEFQVITRIGRIGDTLWVYDGRLRRFTSFTRNGADWAVAATHMVPYQVKSLPGDASDSSALTSMGAEALYADGSVLALLSSRANSEAAGYHVVDRDGRARNFVAPHRFIEQDERKSYLHRFTDGSARGRIFPFAPLPYDDVSSDGSLFAFVETTIESPRGGVFRVTLIDVAGDTVYSREYSFEGVPIPRSVADSAVTAVYESLLQPNAAFDPARSREAAEAWRRKVVVPPAHPPVRDAIVADDSSVWIELRGPRGTEHLRLDASGGVLGKATFPPRTTIVAANATHVWTTVTGELDVPSIHRYRLQ